MNKFIGIITSLSFVPSIALAAPGDVSSLMDYFLEIFDYLIPVLIGLGLLMFIYGVTKYIVVPDAEARKEAKDVIVYGIVILFVMVSVWSLVRLLINTFEIPNSDLDNNNTQNINSLIP